MTQATLSIFDSFTLTPTKCQSKILYMIEEFLENDATRRAFIVRGSAGTGKTSMMKTVVEYLKAINTPFLLLAPTCKAAKILSKRTNTEAATIHSTIYVPEELEDGRIRFNYKLNDNNTKTIFIVDEASMLGANQKPEDGDFVSNNSILADLVKFFQEGNELNQIIFIGDTYQLPPVMENESVALSGKLLAEKYNLFGQQADMKEVVRQAKDSPVLALANEIKARKDTNRDLRYIKINRLYSEQAAIKKFLGLFDRSNLDNVVLIANSNKAVNRLNNLVRQGLKLTNKTLSVGDVVMVSKNWMSKTETVSKGDIGIIQSISPNYEKVADFTFVAVIIKFDNVEIKTKVLIESLLTENGLIDRVDYKQLTADRMAKNSTYRASKLASDDDYIGSIHLRYAYAITCHKAQGSEWQQVLIDPKFDITNHRWLYTAVTRASQSVDTWWY